MYIVRRVLWQWEPESSGMIVVFLYFYEEILVMILYFLNFFSYFFSCLLSKNVYL